MPVLSNTEPQDFDVVKLACVLMPCESRDRKMNWTESYRDRSALLVTFTEVASGFITQKLVARPAARPLARNVVFP